MVQFTKENPATNGAFQVISNDTSVPAKPMEVNGRVARTLQYLCACKAGLTRAEALDKYGVLSLTQHVFILRHTYGLDIVCERVRYDSFEGESNYGRYHLIDNIAFVKNGGVS